MKRSPALRVIPETATQRANQIGKAASKKRRGRFERYSEEIRRDAAISIAEQFDDRESYIRWRDAFALKGTFEARADVPATRAQCPSTEHELCPHVRCRANLVRQDEPSGRPGLASVERDRATGFTKSQRGDMASGKGNPPRIEPLWLVGGCVPDSCALAVADRGVHSNIDLSRVIRKHRTLTVRIVKRALASMARRGVRAEDIARVMSPDDAED